MIRILFLCTGNSCRSQMAEGWVRHLAGDAIQAFSAGVESHGLDPRAVKVMAEAGVDISRQRSKELHELGDREFDYVVTVCDHAREMCPLFPGKAQMLHRSFADPPRLAQAESKEEAKLQHYRSVRDEIRSFVGELVAELVVSESDR